MHNPFDAPPVASGLHRVMQEIRQHHSKALEDQQEPTPPRSIANHGPLNGLAQICAGQPLSVSTPAEDMQLPAWPALYSVDGRCLPAFDQIYSALVLDRVWKDLQRTGLCLADAGNRVRALGQQMHRLAQALRVPPDAPAAFREEFGSEHAVCLDSLQRGLNTDFPRLFDSMAKLAQPPSFFAQTAQAQDRLGWMVYEPALRRALARDFGLDPANPLLAAVLNLRNTNYAQRVMDGLSEADRLGRSRDPLDSEALAQLHRAGVECANSAMFAGCTSFGAPAGRSMTPDGIFDAWKRLQDLNRQAARLTGDATPVWQMTIGNRIVEDMDDTHYTDWQRRPLDTSQTVRIERRPLPAPAGRRLVDQLFEDYENRLARTDPVDAQALTTLVADLCQRLLLAHPFADGNGRVTASLLPQVLLARLQQRGIGPASLHQAHVFDDLWISMLTAPQAAATLQPLAGYPAAAAAAATPGGSGAAH